jgi:hypothetical protein
VDWNGPIIIFLLILLRVAIPVLITFALAYLYERIAARWEAQDRAQQAQMSHETPVIRVQEDSFNIACPIQQRAFRAVGDRPSIPCWLALELSEGHLPEPCLTCAVFKETVTQHSQVV